MSALAAQPTEKAALEKPRVEPPFPLGEALPSTVSAEETPAEAEKQGHRITRIAVAFEAGHDGFWLARWLAAQGIATSFIPRASR
jgi:hypothetical protein